MLRAAAGAQPRESVGPSVWGGAEQLGRALRELGIGSILAYSPQAKGRIERSFLTAQDRLVKHLRWPRSPPWKGPTSFWRRSIGRSGMSASPPVADFLNQHRPLTPSLDLAAILSHVEERVDRQRLHVFLCRASLPNRAPGCASRHAASTLAYRIALGRRAMRVLPGPLPADRLGSDSNDTKQRHKQATTRLNPQRDCDTIDRLRASNQEGNP